MLTLPKAERLELWKRLIDSVERYIDTIDDRPVSSPADVDSIRESLSSLDFARPLSPTDALSFAVEGLWNGQVHTSHARYYGLFNPNPTTMGIAADAVVAAFNPQLAAWSHNPFACEVEQYLVREIGTRFGYDGRELAGSFTSGGAEANHTGLLAALIQAFPEFGDGGARDLGGAPVFYVSQESHHSFAKAARLCGLGTRAAREVPLDASNVMDAAALAECIKQDRAAGLLPFMVVATLGTTNAGLLDPIASICDVAERESLWVHADAAWGGAAVLVPELRGSLAGIERADSITFDAHKWLSVPMGAGMFFTRHREVLPNTFAIQAGYMPVTTGQEIVDPHLHTMQWSRRFIGLKVFLSLLVAGWEGYAEAIRNQARMGDLLREKLRAAGWRVANDTPLPTVCFVDAEGGDNSHERLRRICGAIVDSGEAWISTTVIGGATAVLRATITNYRTQPEDLDALIAGLSRARAESP